MQLMDPGGVGMSHETAPAVAIARYVAVCDVLGFKDLVQSKPLEALREGYHEIIDYAKRAAVSKSETTWKGRTDVGVEEKVGTTVFSDSIIVWSTPVSSGTIDPYRGAPDRTFFVFIGHLILQSLRKTRSGLRFPLRAGIAYGPVIISPEEQIYLGMPIVDAYRLQEAQEWVGAACHQSCLQAPDFEIICDEIEGAQNFVTTKHPVPLNEGRKEGLVNPMPVAWPGMIWWLPRDPEDYYMKTVEDLLRAEEGRPVPESRVVKKWKNTLDFGRLFREFRDPEDKGPL
jgi:class 3 adenylate cyclase